MINPGWTLSADLQTVTLTGVNLDYAGYELSVNYTNVIPSDVTIDSATQITLTFDNLGAPFMNAIVLTYTQTDGDIQYVQEEWNTDFGSLTPTVSDGTSGLQCSFVGGCSYELENTKALAALLKIGELEYKQKITVCNEECILSEEDSTPTKVVCKLPSISTTYSDENFQISTPRENLNSGVFFGTASDNSIAFDGVLTNTISDESQPCNTGMSFKEGHVGMLSQVKYFMPRLNDKSILVNNTFFQGSNDGVNYDDLFMIDSNLHEGFNYHYWTEPEDQP